ncbi:MAG: prolipoprotein diacylglyceryl transferase [Smithellaceae bacterium]
MLDEIFTLSLATAMAVLFTWAFKKLPGEDWQILACVPGSKGVDGMWNGINLTYYGLFNAFAYLFAVVMFLIMTGALGMTLSFALALLAPVLIVCMWAARIIARLVEKKPHTFSVGAAAFAGIILAPAMMLSANITMGRWLAFQIPVVEVMSAMFIAYAFGEGIGRLACISFGCCYGRPLDSCPPIIKKLFRQRHFVFRGETKKIAYAHQLEGRAVVPIQALTAVLYSGTGLLGFYFFLKGYASASLMITLLVTQIWRFLSEFLRADYRGENRVSAYQVMTLLAVAYTLAVVALTEKTAGMMPDLLTGITALWEPGLLIFLGILWVVAFLYTGKSSVTSSFIDIQVVKKNI